MPTIYRYTPHVDPGPAGSVTRFANTDDAEGNPLIQRIGVLNGQEYISVPDAVTLPAQPDAITLEEVTVTPELRLDLIRANVALDQSKQGAREHVREIVGDAEDQIADLEKRVSVMERIMYQLAWRILDGQATDDLKSEFGNLLQMYVDGVNDGSIRTRSDLHFAGPLVQSIIERSNAVVAAVEDHAARVNELLP